tara:strand:- start:47 stop:637 length:591 start_codon:yes stop_codon:yes gene_type:complete
MNPKLIGITGGIGSGKSTVSQIFKHLGYKIYNSDLRAKELIKEPAIKDKLKNAFGDKIFRNDILDKELLSEIIFENKSALKKINSIVHPEVKKDFKNWIKKNSKNKILFKESALLIESETYKELDKIILIIADKDIRVSRILKRDKNRSKKEIDAIIDNQVYEKEAIKHADIIIENDQKNMLLPKVVKGLDKLLKD